MNLETLIISFELTPFQWGLDARSESWIGGGSRWLQIGPLCWSVNWENG